MDNCCLPKFDEYKKILQKGETFHFFFEGGGQTHNEEATKGRIKKKDRSKANLSLQDIFANAYSFATHLPSPILLNGREPRVPFCFSSH